RQSRARAGPGWAPVRAPWRDDARVARNLADPLERPAQLHDRDAADFGVFWVNHVELLASSQSDSLTDDRELASFGTLGPKAELRRVDDRVEHSSIRHVDGHSADTRDLDHGVQSIDETGNILEFHRSALPISAFRYSLDRSGGSIDHHDLFGLRHRHGAGLEQ